MISRERENEDRSNALRARGTYAGWLAGHRSKTHQAPTTWHDVIRWQAEDTGMTAAQIALAFQRYGAVMTPGAMGRILASDPTYDLQGSKISLFNDVTGAQWTLDYLADAAGGMFVKPVSPDPATVAVEIIPEVLRETADVVAELGDALADGVIDDGERVRIRKEVREAISLLLAIEAGMEEEGVRAER